ncbi:MAG: M14 family metallopeptidase [Pseudomonadota bacterium]|nr:M14 family metallopeptidase [Pseudomonadota bacterium]
MSQSHPITRAERTGYQETSRHADVMQFIADLDARADRRLRVLEFGATPEGRELPLLVLSSDGVATPAEAAQLGRPVVLVMCGIHAGEVEGKEGGLMFVRDVLDGVHGDLLSKVTLLLVPLFNADGNERVDPANRRLDIAHFNGQLGPDSGVGTRVNAAGINLNRDYMRQDGAEMRLLQTRVMHPWNPHLVIDCHATNGSIHRYALTYDVPHAVHSGRREPVDYMKQSLLPWVSARVKEAEGMDSFYYGNFLRDEGGQGMGWITYTHHPRFGGNYRGLGNRLDLLLEAYSYIPFAERVQVTYAFVREALAYVAAHADEVLSLLRDCQMPPQRIAVRYRLEEVPGLQVDILTREPYTLDGAPVSVKVPYLGEFVPDHWVDRPAAYAVPEAIAQRLRGHGLQILDDSRHTLLDVEVAAVTGHVSQGGRGILEASAAPYLEVRHRRERRPLPEGWVLVPTQQQRGAVAVYLCEAESDDGLVACEWIQPPAIGAEFPAWRVLELPGG